MLNGLFSRTSFIGGGIHLLPLKKTNEEKNFFIKYFIINFEENTIR